MIDLNKIRPLEDNILVEPMEKEQTSASGIVIPDTSKEKPQEGRVVATGPGKKNDKGEVMPLGVKVGDRVLYKKWGGSEIKIVGKEYLMVRGDDVMAILGE